MCPPASERTRRTLQNAVADSILEGKPEEEEVLTAAADGEKIKVERKALTEEKKEYALP